MALVYQEKRDHTIYGHFKHSDAADLAGLPFGSIALTAGLACAVHELSLHNRLALTY